MFQLERNEQITGTRARGMAFDVRDEDGRRVGVLSHGELGWRVYSAGYSVKVDHNAVHKFRDAAVAAIVEAREIASRPGGALAVDTSGLTGHQRQMIAVMREYAMVSSAKRDAVIWDHFEMSPTQFFVEWNALIDNPLALAYSPTVVNRHRRLREQRAAARTGRLRKTAVPA
jgi:hypothetical protein